MYGGGNPAILSTEWSSGLCSCLEDCGDCLLTCFCPCITNANTRTNMDPNASWVGCCCYGLLCPCFAACTGRGAVRETYGIVGGGMGDCILGCLCCPICALCQNDREVNYRKKIGAGPMPRMA